MTATSTAERHLPAPRLLEPDLLERVATIAALEGWTDTEGWCDDIASGLVPEDELHMIIDSRDLYDRLGLTPAWVAAERYGV